MWGGRWHSRPPGTLTGPAVPEVHAAPPCPAPVRLQPRQSVISLLVTRPEPSAQLQALGAPARVSTCSANVAAAPMLPAKASAREPRQCYQIGSGQEQVCLHPAILLEPDLSEN